MQKLYVIIIMRSIYKIYLYNISGTTKSDRYENPAVNTFTSPVQFGLLLIPGFKTFQRAKNSCFRTTAVARPLTFPQVAFIVDVTGAAVVAFMAQQSSVTTVAYNFHITTHLTECGTRYHRVR